MASNSMVGPWLVQLCCVFLGLMRETIRSFGFGREYLHCCGNFKKWDLKDIYGCYDKSLLFYPISFCFSIQLLMVKDLVGMKLSFKVRNLFIMYELSHTTSWLLRGNHESSDPLRSLAFVLFLI